MSQPGIFNKTIACFIFVIWCCERNSFADSVPPSDEHAWVDPGQMVSSEWVSAQEDHNKDEHKEQDGKGAAAIPVKTIAKPINNKEKCDLAHFKHLTRIIIDAFPTPGKRYATIELSEDDLAMLQEFRRNDNKGEKLYDVSEIILGIFKHMEEDEQSKQSYLTLSFVAYNKEVFAVVFIVGILIMILIIFEFRTAMPWYQQFWYLFGLLFITSIPWEWFRLYRKAFAEKQAEFIKDIPSYCEPKNMTIPQRFSLWMAGIFSWKSDGCTAYQEAILVDPVWEVSPSLALSITVTRLFVDPLVYVADTCGKCLNAFLSKVPTVWQPVMIVLMTVIFLLCILMFTKSRIKFGFFEIGPAPFQVRRFEKEDMDALRACIRKEIRDVDRRAIVAPIREGKVEKFQRAVQEERAKDHDEASGVQEALCDTTTTTM